MPEPALCFPVLATVQSSSANLLLLTDEIAYGLVIFSAVEWALLFYYMFKPTPEWAEKWFPA